MHHAIQLSILYLFNATELRLYICTFLKWKKNIVTWRKIVITKDVCIVAVGGPCSRMWIEISMLITCLSRFSSSKIIWTYLHIYKQSERKKLDHYVCQEQTILTFKPWSENMLFFNIGNVYIINYIKNVCYKCIYLLILFIKKNKVLTWKIKWLIFFQFLMTVLYNLHGVVYFYVVFNCLINTGFFLKHRSNIYRPSNCLFYMYRWSF